MHEADEAYHAGAKIKVPEPNKFKGVRSAKELDNFIWDMKHYFKAAKIQKAERVSITTMILVGDAKLWWTRMTNDLGTPKY